ncbi:MAG: hypothetical protein AMK75_06400 [Planctomycetes bacterium SM23_65]|nr:MAG: hypothetical protein AMK75_06400 [Planctomycetes bacterium SM23_65]
METVKGLCLLVGIALLLPVHAANAYQWYHVAVDTIDYPTYEIQFGPEMAYVGTEAGVYRGYGLNGSWEGMGLDYPGLGAYSILYLRGAGWEKQVINESLLYGATGVGIATIDAFDFPDVVVAAFPPGNCAVWYENPRPGPSAPHWTEHDVDPDALGAREVSLADIDRDGDIDIAAALRDEDLIVWYENIVPAPVITWPMYEIGPMAGPRGVFAADINEDDRLDVVAGGMNNDTVGWFEAPLDPTDPWMFHTVDDSLDAVKGVFAIDVDGDEDLDIVAAGREAGDVVWYEQGIPHGRQSWDKHYIDDDLAGVVSVWCGDLTGDERPEVAVTAKYAAKVVVYEQLADPTLPWNVTVLDAALPEACPISAADFDGDGRTDIVAAGREAGVVAWYRSPPEGSNYWQKFVIDNAAGHSMGIAAGDLDNDGDADVVATAKDEGTVTVYWNDLRDIYCAFTDGTGLCESDGIYRWHDTTEEWVATWWCPRPFFVCEHPLVPGQCYCGNFGGFFTSTDLTVWQELGAATLPDTVTACWFHPTDPNVMLVGTCRGMYRTTDFGLTWALVNEGVSDLPVMDIETGQSMPVPPWFVFASIGDGSFSDGVFRSDNEGVDWQRILFMPFPTDLLQDYERSDMTRTVMFLGFRGAGIHRIDHSGFYSGNLNTGLPNLIIYRMRYDPYIDTLAVYGCTDGGLYLCMLLEPTDVGPGVSGTAVCRASPNPWRDRVGFSVTGLRRTGPASLRVFDIAGREVWSWHGTLSSGASLQWDGRDAHGRPLASGVYFYRVELAGEIQEGKVVHLR